MREKRKGTCRSCEYLNFNFIHGRYEPDQPPYCGLHGMAPVDPDGKQPNLDGRGGCGYCPKKVIQLEIDFKI